MKKTIKQVNRECDSPKHDGCISRRDFIKKAGLASLMATGISGFANISCTDDDKTKKTSTGLENNTVYLVKNGDCEQNISKLWDMMGGVESFIDEDDVVVIKGNGQWPNQGYTHTGCIKAVIDEIFNTYPGFSGEIFICDNVQEYGSNNSFIVTGGNRDRNMAEYNWTELAAYYQANSKKVTAKKWVSTTETIDGPQDGVDGWMRESFAFHDITAYLSYPVFQSELVPGRMIDMKYGVWEGGAIGGYTGRKVKAIFMPTLNNHGTSSNSDYAGVTSAIKSFFGATEIHGGIGGTFNSTDWQNIHDASYSYDAINGATYAGELAARYINNFYKPVLYITAAMWTGYGSRTGTDATETKTVLACTNPVTLDYIACKEVIGPLNNNLNPDENNNTRNQILGCLSGGIGTITEGEYTVERFDFDEA